MKLHLASDIHLEFGKFNHTPPECDVVVLAGDIGTGVSGVMWAGETFDKPVVMISGNHEFYGRRRLHRHYEKMKAKAQEYNNVHFLQNESVVIDGVRFIGCTLWTDFKLIGNQPIVMMNAKSMMNDYQHILFDIGKPIQPFHILTEHEKSVEFIVDELSKPFDGKTVVVTHHLPSEQSCFPEYKGNSSNVFYASNLESLIQIYKPILWLHGHTHNSRDYMIDETRIVCNPRGYVGYALNPEFKPDLVIEI